TAAAVRRANQQLTGVFTRRPRQVRDQRRSDRTKRVTVETVAGRNQRTKVGNITRDSLPLRDTEATPNRKSSMMTASRRSEVVPAGTNLDQVHCGAVVSRQ